MTVDSTDPVHLDTDDLEFRDLLDDEYPHRLQSVVLPIIVLEDGLVHLRGTAFSIGNNLALTAHHVLRQEDTGIEEVALLHVVPGAAPGQVHATLLQVEDVTAHPGDTDVAVLRIRPPDAGEHNPLPLRPMRIGMAPPAVGHPATTLGYRHEGPLGSVEDVLQMRPRLMASTGQVSAHSPSGYVLCKGPCFQITSASEGQMSGGPVLAPAGDGTDLVIVRGVLSSGMDLPADAPPSSTASMTFTAMALSPLVDSGATQSPTFLYDLAADGRLPVHELQLVDWAADDPAQPRIGLRPI